MRVKIVPPMKRKKKSATDVEGIKILSGLVGNVHFIQLREGTDTSRVLLSVSLRTKGVKNKKIIMWNSRVCVCMWMRV